MIRVDIDDEQAVMRINGLLARTSDMRGLWPQIHAYMISVITLQFNKLGKGGNARGVHWDDFKHQYIRSFGFKVPAAGGVSKVHNPMLKVLGRKRGYSRQRVNASSRLLQNTGTLKNALLQKSKATKTTFTMDTADKKGKVQFQDKLRPFQFFEIPRDEMAITDMAVKYLMG